MLTITSLIYTHRAVAGAGIRVRPVAAAALAADCTIQGNFGD